MKSARLTALRATLALALISALGVSTALAAPTATAPDFPNQVSGSGLHAFGTKPVAHPQHINVAALAAPDEWTGWAQVPADVRDNVRRSFGTLGSPLSANVQASNPAGDAASETQSECAITAFGQYVVVAWNDSKGFTAGFTLSSYAYSCDFGATFTDGGNVPLAVAGDQAFGDCVLDHDAANNVYLSSIYTRAGVQGIGVWKGTFGAGCPTTFTWNTPVLAHTGTADDKNWHACDQNAIGKIYVTFTNFALSPLAIQEVHSTNGGATWSVAQTLSVGSPSVQGSQVIVDPAGTVHVAWQNGTLSIPCDNSSVAAQQINYVKSTNGGVSYSANTSIATIQPNWMGWGPGNLRSTANSFPSLGVDRSGGPRNGELFLTWAESATYPAPAAASGVSIAENEGLLNSNPGSPGVQTLNLGDNGTGGLTISTDTRDYWKINLVAGQHAELLLEPQGFNCGVAGTTRNFLVRMYANPLNQLVSPPDTILGNSNVNGFQSRLVFDVKQTGVYSVRVGAAGTSASTGTGTYTLKTRNIVAYSSPNATTPARDMRDVVEIHSLDAGATWSSKQLVNADAPVGYEETLPFCTVDGSGVAYIFWFDRRETETLPRTSYEGQWTDVYMGKSIDGGVTWAGGQRISDESSLYNNNTLAIPNMGDYNTAAAAGCNTYACWTDERKSHTTTSAVDCFVDRFNACVTPIRISEFDAQAGRGYVDVTFNVFVDGLAKIQVFRAASRGGDYSPVSDEMEGVGQKSFSFRDKTAQVGTEYWYKVGYQQGGSWTFSNPIRVKTPVAQFALHPALPNPSRGAMRIDYEIERSGRATLEVYNLNGQRVRTLVDGAVQAGVGSAAWDGRTQSGQSLPTGAYFARLTSAGKSLTQRLMLIH